MMLLLLFVTIMIFLVVLTPINVFVEYKREDEIDNLEVRTEILFGLITYKLHIPHLEIKKIFADSLLKIRAEIEATGSPKMEIEKEKDLSWEEMDWESLLEQLKFISGLVDQFEAMERVLDTFKDEIHRLEELTFRNPILLRIVGFLMLSLEGRCTKITWHTQFGIKNPAITGIVTGLLWSIKGGIYSFLHRNAKEVAQPDFKVIPNFNQVNELEVKFKSIFSLRLGNVISRGLRIILTRYRRRLAKKWETTQLKH